MEGCCGFEKDGNWRGNASNKGAWRIVMKQSIWIVGVRDDININNSFVIIN